MVIVERENLKVVLNDIPNVYVVLWVISISISFFEILWNVMVIKSVCIRVKSSKHEYNNVNYINLVLNSLWRKSHL